MQCKRGHGKWHQIKVITKDGEVTKCDYIMGVKMVGDTLNKTIMCGDLPIGEKIPEGYMGVVC